VNTKILGAALLLAAALAAARPDQPAAEGELGVAALRARLDELAREEDEAERRARAFADEAKAQLAARKEERHALAEALVAARVDRERLAQRAQELDARLATARARAAAATHATESLPPECTALLEQIVLVLDGMPGQGDLAARAAAVRHDLGDDATRDDAVARLPALLADTLDAASNLRVRRVDLRVASGRIVPADLLTAGNVAFAYRGTDGAIGVALASPADATGYRWTESVAAATRRAAAAAFDDVAGGAETCRVPMDPSGMLRVDDELHGWTFARIWDSGGPMMWPLAGVAVLAFLLVCERVLYLARQGGRAEATLERVLEASARGDWDAANETCARGRGLVARGLAACLRYAGKGTKAMENGFQEHLLHELPRLERSLSQIGTLAAVAPLLGLLGTVTGIIQTFGVIKTFGNANPGLMAGGIAEALLTTAAGLVIAIPTLLFYNLLQARVEALTGYAEQAAATVLNRLGEESPA